MTEKRLTLGEMAKRITAHLRRFEADPVINARDGYGMSPYYYAGASRAGRFVKVKYISFQHASNLTKEEAERYLAWLDAGNVGRHRKALDQ